MPEAPPGVSVVVPTFREAPNIKPLVERVFAALKETGWDIELIIVDDHSQDGTEEIVESLRGCFPVRLIVRRRERGLSSAVVTGFREARYDRFVVMDADLQHPPEMLVALTDRLEQEDCDFVIGTRYAGAGAIDEGWPILRRLASRIATALARPLMPLSDPMSGFFALRRSTFERAEKLDPIGYKIGLELFVKCRCARPAEVPIRFATRAAGESKLSVVEQVRYLRHLSRLYRFRYPAVTRGLVLVAMLTVVGITIALARLAW